MGTALFLFFIFLQLSELTICTKANESSLDLVNFKGFRVDIFWVT